MDGAGRGSQLQVPRRLAKRIVGPAGDGLLPAVPPVAGPDPEAMAGAETGDWIEPIGPWYGRVRRRQTDARGVTVDVDRRRR